MRSPDADYVAIDAALRPHERVTLHAYATTRGCVDWRDDTIARIVAVALVVDNAVSESIRGGLNERQALLHAAVTFDLDLETLQRERRRARRRARQGGPA